MLCALTVVVLNLLALTNPSAAAPTPTAVGTIRPSSIDPGNYHAKYDTIAHQMLDDEAALGDVTPGMYALLDAVIDRAKGMLGTPSRPYVEMSEPEAIRVLQTIDRSLYDHGFVYPGDAMDWVDRLSDGLRPRNMNAAEISSLELSSYNTRRPVAAEASRHEPFYLVDCDIASFLYLAIGQQLGLPIAMVQLPWHEFIRWTLSDGSTFDFETMDGLPYGDEHYLSGGFGATQTSLQDGDFMVGMTPDEVRGYYWTTLASEWEKVPGAEWKELADARFAIALYPRYDGVWNELAWAHVMSDNPVVRKDPSALDAANKAVAIYPEGSESLDTRACVYAELGDFKHAIEDETAAANGYAGRPKEYRTFANAIKAYQVKKTCYFARRLHGSISQENSSAYVVDGQVQLGSFVSNSTYWLADKPLGLSGRVGKLRKAIAR